MITENGKLEIFENFRVDRDLPKHEKKRRRRGSSHDEMVSKAGSVVDDGDDGEEMSDSEMMVGIEHSSILASYGVMPRRRRRGIWGKLLRVFSREKKISVVSLDRFFRSLMDSREQVELVGKRPIALRQMRNVFALQVGFENVWKKRLWGSPASPNEAFYAANDR